MNFVTCFGVVCPPIKPQIHVSIMSDVGNCISNVFVASVMTGNTGNACYQLRQNLLSYYFLSKNLKPEYLLYVSFCVVVKLGISSNCCSDTGWFNQTKLHLSELNNTSNKY
jgi:hypothetical protein